MTNAGDRAPRRATDGLAGRLGQMRWLIAAAAAALAGAWAIWDVPALYALASIAGLVAVAALAQRSRVGMREGPGESRADVWPETPVKAIVEALPHPTYVLDRDSIVRYANAEAQRAFPATRIGDLFTLTFRAPDIGAALRALPALRRASVKHREGGEREVIYDVSFSSIIRPGQNGMALVMFEDVTDRLAIERMRADFVSNASHELRTPLASLTGFIETLQGPARNDPAAIERFLKVMLEQAQRMRRLIDDLLSLSRAETRAHRRPTETVELAGILRHVADALAPVAAEEGVAVKVTAEAPAPVRGDRDELVQVFQNLVENAIRYGASGKRVEVSLTRRSAPATAMVEVRDFGPGIAPEHLPRLTERFYRADMASSHERKGTGLGLAIVKHILTRHQGRLDVASPPGEGAVFTVELPLIDSEAAGEREKSLKSMA